MSTAPPDAPQDYPWLRGTAARTRKPHAMVPVAQLRALLAERDQLAAALEELRGQPTDPDLTPGAEITVVITGQIVTTTALGSMVLAYRDHAGLPQTITVDHTAAGVSFLGQTPTGGAA